MDLLWPKKLMKHLLHHTRTESISITLQDLYKFFWTYLSSIRSWTCRDQGDVGKEALQPSISWERTPLRKKQVLPDIGQPQL
jgi:hypothetical protein